jgi:UDPglucose 6-dehydrogenase
MKITIFGVGYVGLVTGACLADAGHDVMCVDINEQRISQLKKGIIPIFEPGLDQLVRRNASEGRLKFTTDAAAGVNFGILQFIAVGTPPNEDGSADLQHVLAVANTIGRHMTDYKVVIDKSTVPVGTGDKVKETIRKMLGERNIDIKFDVCSNPEFLKEGAAIEDFTRAARIIVGTDSEHVQELMQECYMPYNRNHDKLITMDIRSAELTKYAANAMLATKISFMNEVANLAEILGVDIEEVRNGIGSDPRIGYHFIYPGCGYGGSCFPKDVQALIRTGESQGYTPALLKQVEAVNDRQKHRLFEKIIGHFGGAEKLRGKMFAIWGLAFKPNTDDMREAPSRVLMEALWTAGARIQAYDPEAMEEVQRIYGNRDDLALMGTKESVLRNADALVVCTEWKSFLSPDFSELQKLLPGRIVFDGRNLYDPARMHDLGWTYYGVGRGKSIAAVAANTPVDLVAA